MQPVSRALTLILDHPLVTLACAAAVVFALALHIPRFELDASAESLTLENDRALRYYRSTAARYGGDGFLVVTYTPRSDLFSAGTLNAIGRLRDDLRALPRVRSVTTLLDVPLLQSPPVGLSDLMDEPRTLLSPGTDLSLARREFTESPLYRNLLVGEQGRTAALYVTLAGDERHRAIVAERDALYEARLERDLTADERARLDALSKAARDRAAAIAGQLRNDVVAIRDVVARYRSGAEIHLAGTPLIPGIASSLSLLAMTLTAVLQRFRRLIGAAASIVNALTWQVSGFTTESSAEC